MAQNANARAVTGAKAGKLLALINQLLEVRNKDVLPESRVFRHILSPGLQSLFLGYIRRSSGMLHLERDHGPAGVLIEHDHVEARAHSTVAAVLRDRLKQDDHALGHDL